MYAYTEEGIIFSFNEVSPTLVMIISIAFTISLLADQILVKSDFT